MKFSQLISATALAGTALAANAAEVEFLTVLVNDLKANKPSYLVYVATATNVPSGITELAIAVQTYTDTSYTTLLDSGAVDVAAIEAFAEGLPWYSRLEAKLTPIAGSSSAAATSSAAASSAASSAAKSSAASSAASSAVTSAASSAHTSAAHSSSNASSSAAASSAKPAVSTAVNGAGSSSAVGVTLLTVGSLIACLF